MPNTSSCSPNSSTTSAPGKFAYSACRANLGQRSRRLYSPTVSSDLWFGAVTTLAGAALGGASTYLVSRLQIRESRAQRVETERWDRARRNADRRFDAYANFLSQARRYRNVIRPYRLESGPGMTIQEIDAVAREATAAGSLVFLVYDNPATEAACRSVLRTIRDTVGVIHEVAPDLDGVPWEELNDDMARVLLDFQAAARTELEVTGNDIERFTTGVALVCSGPLHDPRVS